MEVDFLSETKLSVMLASKFWKKKIVNTGISIQQN